MSIVAVPLFSNTAATGPGRRKLVTESVIDASLVSGTTAFQAFINQR